MCPYEANLRVNFPKLWITPGRRFETRQTQAVRWDDLFDDLASQFDAGLEEERRRALIDEERLRVSRLTTRDRLSALASTLQPDEHIGLQLHSGDRVDIVPVEIGADWLGADLVGPAHRYGACLIALGGIGALLLTPEQVARSMQPLPERAGGLSARLGFGIALRDLARRRVACEFSTRLGVVYGTVDRVGRDHLDIAVHDPEVPRRASAVITTRILPLDDLLVVRIRTTD